MLEAVRKVPLGRSLDLFRCLFPDEFSFHPRSWFLPQQFTEFSDAVRQKTTTTTTMTPEPPSRMLHTVAQRRDQQQQLQQQMMVVQPSKPCSHCVFIVKPDEGSQGEGIYLIQVSARCSCFSVKIIGIVLMKYSISLYFCHQGSQIVVFWWLMEVSDYTGIKQITVALTILVFSFRQKPSNHLSTASQWDAKILLKNIRLINSALRIDKSINMLENQSILRISHDIARFVLWRRTRASTCLWTIAGT